MAKKSARILVGLVCSVSGRRNYVTTLNKLNTQDLKLRRFSPATGKHEIHTVTKKLD